MPRSSSLAITIVHTAAPANPDDIRALIHAAIDAMNHQLGLEGASDPSGPVTEAGAPDRGAVRGPGPLRPA